MEDWTMAQWAKNLVIIAAVFAIMGGIIAQTTEGASGRGFLEGMWKGIEWFLIIGISAAVLFGAWVGIMTLSGSLNH